MMPTAIPDELQAFVEREIASGKFRSEEEVISTALRLLREREQRHDALRADLQEGVDDLDRRWPRNCRRCLSSATGACG